VDSTDLVGSQDRKDPSEVLEESDPTDRLVSPGLRGLMVGSGHEETKAHEGCKVPKERHPQK